MTTYRVFFSHPVTGISYSQLYVLPYLQDLYCELFEVGEHNHVVTRILNVDAGTIVPLPISQNTQLQVLSAVEGAVHAYGRELLKACAEAPYNYLPNGRIA